MYTTTRPGWDVETSHPTEAPDESVQVCAQCLGMIDPTIAFAVDWGSPAFQAQTTDSEGLTHTVVVRAVTP